VEKVEVFWTVDAGPEDIEIGKIEGAIGLRRARIERLMKEALTQGAAATQEDLAWSLNVDTRTVRRDCAWLRAEGKEVPTRGNLQGIGRGQTHKRQILARWLAGETYDQITLQCHHNAASVSRYIQGFVRVVHLTNTGFSSEEVAMLLPMSRSLVGEYLAVYAENDTALAHRRLKDHRRRIAKGVPRVKKGVG
jgi:response regulator of citrate/malate metabolism